MRKARQPHVKDRPIPAIFFILDRSLTSLLQKPKRSGIMLHAHSRSGRRIRTENQPKDHFPPHVHVIKAGAVIRVNLLTGDLMTGESKMSANDIRLPPGLPTCRLVEKGMG
jgi:hypothetical protein